MPSPPADSPADASPDAVAADADPAAAADAAADAVVIRPAATVMLVRDAPEATSEDDRLEVLMVRRNLRSDFVGGAYVFPGGSVDPADAGPAAEAASFGRTDAEASALLGVGTGGLAYWVAVLRETFEEAGLLLAERPGGPALLAGDPDEEARFVSERAAVNAGTRRFLDLCREEGLRLMVGDVHYFAHWITPRGAPRRFDTRFFVAPAPPGQHAAHDAGETIAETWISPRRALAAHRSGDFELIFPTIRNLQAISRFTSAGDLLEAAALASGVGADDRTAGGGGRQRGADRPARGRRVRRERPGRGARSPRCPRSRGTSTKPCARVSLAANQEDPTS